ncbi:MAG: GGDEF domain-containing response regulator [Chlamydiota bacterium]
MKGTAIRVLLIEDEPEQAALIGEMLSTDGSTPAAGYGCDRAYALECAPRLSKGITRLASGGIDVVLLDLSLPDSKGLETYAKVHASSPDVPIVIVTSSDREEYAVKALSKGAQDYIFKGTINREVFRRSIYYAIERNKLQMKLRAMSLEDELTGLNNRRGFYTLTAQQIKMERRMKRGMSLIFADIDDLKRINDNFGHYEGDRALAEFACILKRCFREADIIARIGGDEFAVLTTGDRSEKLIERLQIAINARNARGDLGYTLSASAGAMICQPGKPCSTEDLLRRADEAMYTHKRIGNAMTRHADVDSAGVRGPEGGRYGR